MAEVLTAAADLAGPQNDGCFTLTYTERLIGFGITGLCGLVAGILSIVAVFILNMRKFVVLFTLSSILYLVSLCLLIGFKRICGSFTDPKRIYSAVGLLAGTLITLYFGFVKKWIILSLVGFVIEFLSFVYYALTFIPGGEKIFHFLLF
ncbi:pRGR, putative [Trichomonas vaginalis G3]|uniref:Vesicle transport protein n=1 Tax=Trichomonas vaginalis (strain ATCC PRA-98 / G3) TaxID=412133 RepID=A2F3W5_TRIV3|nr:vesicle-mediated transport [Trichomonas vaginalis G3]EAY00381.1 pRGR, putative [Trichomonas vaginalis G3]KAI5528350.1 vesicle-mediated transport [Trichomonas vaginalis G3]|eukprot:XP_001313310.1 pRGR [Trichomonas vaginalis G3]